MMNSLRELLVDEVKDLYSAENQLVKALPRLVKHAHNRELKSALEMHLRQTEEHVRRLERVADMLGMKPRGKKCIGMEGLIEEGKEMLSQDADADTLDAGLIGAAQKVEHYEIAAYGTARTHATQSGHREIADMLQQTLDEESQANEKLTQIAETMVNPTAAGDGFRSRAEHEAVRR